MSASESSPIASNLQESIEQLIAETVKRSQSSHEEEKQQLTAALQTALGEIESGQAALQRAADALQAVLNNEATVEDEPAASAETTGEEVPVDIAEAIPEPEKEPAAEAEPVNDVGPHDLDVIAHNVTIGIASSLQAMLRGLTEVKSAQTREFVNGELRLELAMESGLDMGKVNSWIAEHGGTIATHTDSVLELRFGS